MNISELSGNLLDFWVAKALRDVVQPDGNGGWIDIAGKPYKPSTDPARGQPMMERELVHSAPMPGKNWIWCAIAVPRDERGPGSKAAWQEGRTQLAAGMRAIVSSRYGTEVSDLPQE
jgi:hypothetical protein